MAVNDDIYTSLVEHGGSTINKRVYNYLGSLGYTGTISDRLAKHSFEGKKGWQALIAEFVGISLSELQALINDLFGDGSTGLFFVPQPGFKGKDTLYQLEDGTTLADANGDPVGLGLEWSQGLELGDNASLIQLGEWTEVAENDYDHVNTSGEGLFFSAVPGSYHRITVEYDLVNEFIVRNKNAGNIIARIPAGTGLFSEIIKPSGDQIEIYRGFQESTGTFRNFSFRELPGNHLTQSTSADRPLYQTDGSKHWLEHDQAGDNLVASLPDLGTNATLAYANAAGVTILEGQTISGDTIIPQEVELYGVIYLDRPFTTSETTQVTDYLNKRRGA